MKWQKKRNFVNNFFSFELGITLGFKRTSYLFFLFSPQSCLWGPGKICPELPVGEWIEWERRLRHETKWMWVFCCCFSCFVVCGFCCFLFFRTITGWEYKGFFYLREPSFSLDDRTWQNGIKLICEFKKGDWEGQVKKGGVFLDTLKFIQNVIKIIWNDFF